MQKATKLGYLPVFFALSPVTYSLDYNFTLLSRYHLFYQTHFHFYFKAVTGFSNFIVAKQPWLYFLPLITSHTILVA